MNDQNQTITTARNFLKGKVDSLKRDSEQCLFKEHPAPFPALLYCFSIIDLMGALYAGNAKSDAPVTKQAKDYMTGIMKYPQDIADLVQKVFRHKLVHLAQPNPVTSYNYKKYLWYFCHESNRNIHLKIEPTGQNSEYWFKISIWNFVEDIEESVFGSNGYMDQLVKNNGNLQVDFENVFSEISTAD